MDSHERSRIAIALDTRAGGGADPVGNANALIAILGDIEAALIPLIGARGVAALYKRSLFLSMPVHPWLAVVYEEVRHETTFDRLQSVMQGQSGDDAIAGGRTLLDTLEQLLVSLVGPSLTERLLYSASTHPTRDTSLQDPP